MIIYQYRNSSRMIFQFQLKFETTRIPTRVWPRIHHQPRCVDKYFSNSHFSLSFSLSHSLFFCSFISWKISSLVFIYIPRYKSTLVIPILHAWFSIVPILCIFPAHPTPCFFALSRDFHFIFAREDFFQIK